MARTWSKCFWPARMPFSSSGRMFPRSVIVPAAPAARAWRPSVLVLDIGMPDEDGYELLPRLRRELGTGPEDLPAIALTGFAAPVDVSRAARAGFQAHVAKPFEVDALLRVVVRLIAR